MIGLHLDFGGAVGELVKLIVVQSLDVCTFVLYSICSRSVGFADVGLVMAPFARFLIVFGWSVWAL